MFMWVPTLASMVVVSEFRGVLLRLPIVFSEPYNIVAKEIMRELVLLTVIPFSSSLLKFASRLLKRISR